MARKSPYPKWFRRAVIGTVAGIAALNFAFPPPLGDAYETSRVVTDKDGIWLSAFSVENGRWRIKADLDRIDPRFVERLIWTEDQRFNRHSGVDPLAVVRASKSWVKYGRPVSGASTLTMQLVRQLEHRPRTLGSKAKEGLRALQIEARLSKREILELYLTHISYGGAYEGIEAATLGYFGKSPKELTDAEIALLIAIPQSPEARRPDRNPEAAKTARDALLREFADAGLITPLQRDEAIETPVPTARKGLPQTAWVTSRAIAQQHASKTQPIVQSTLDYELQAAAERITKSAAERLGRQQQVAILVVDNKTMKVRASIGSVDRQRAGGWIDMTSRSRSPGSTLKPFIYGLAFDDGLATPGSQLMDVPTKFGSYQPENFNRRYYGSVSVAQALQHSLNIPAVAALDAIGEARFEGAFRRAGIHMDIPRNARRDTGLAVALGGVGITPRDLAKAYAGLANGGVTRDLRWTEDQPLSKPAILMSSKSAQQISKILRTAPTPQGHVPAWLVDGAPPIAYKTGTSYGFRDVWAAGYSPDWTVIVWVGRPDGAAGRGGTGRDIAAPILFDLFSQLGVERVKPYDRPEQAPRGLSAFDVTENRDIPVILFPADKTEVLMDDSLQASVILKGRSSNGEVLNWYVDGQMLARGQNRAVWTPSGPGFYKITAVNETGRKALSRIRVMTTDVNTNPYDSLQ